MCARRRVCEHKTARPDKSSYKDGWCSGALKRAITKQWISIQSFSHNHILHTHKYKHLSSFITSVRRGIKIDSWVAQLRHNVPHVAGQRVHCSVHVCCCCTTDSKHQGNFTHKGDCLWMIDENSLWGFLEAPQNFNFPFRL